MDQLDIGVRQGPANPANEPGVQQPQVADSERVLWAEFIEARTAEAFCQSWLALQCRKIGSVRGALILLGPPGRGPFTPAAVWPTTKRSMKYLTATAEQALREGRGLLLKREPNAEEAVPARVRYDIAYPIQVEGKMCGVVVLDVPPRTESELQAALRQLHWGGAWLEVLLRRENADRDAATRERMQAVLDLVAASVGHDRFRGAATAFATELATRVACDRVSVGFIEKGHARVHAISHTAQFDKKTNLIRAIEAAMDEALDQRETIVYPSNPNGTIQVTRAHETLGKQYDVGAVTSIPLMGNEQAIGAVTLERPEDRPFDVQTLELCEAAAGLAGPILDVKRRDDRWLVTKAVAAGRDQLAALFGPEHLGMKLAVTALTGLVAFFALFTWDFQVTGRTVTEGFIQRAAVAPFDGYVAQAPLKAGDVVSAGDVLATLEDRELKLERLKRISELEQAEKEYRQALAERDAAQVEISSAQIAQSRAQLTLVEDRLARTKIVAPFDGMVVTGDLTQSLGAPVTQGDVLFEVAPLDSFRIILQVDERDITYVSVGQHGRLLLSAMPNDPLPFDVTKVTPVSEAAEGRNYFRVEARLTTTPDRVRPGMEGIGKIEIETRLLIWILARPAADWVRLELWRWLP